MVIKKCDVYNFGVMLKILIERYRGGELTISWEGIQEISFHNYHCLHQIKMYC
jgi:hypothetical protein